MIITHLLVTSYFWVNVKYVYNHLCISSIHMLWELIFDFCSETLVEVSSDGD